MNITYIVQHVLQPGLEACWSWFNSIFDSIGGAASFVIAIFTMICAIRFFIMPLVGYHRVYARGSTYEERPRGYSDPQRDYATWA